MSASTRTSDNDNWHFYVRHVPEAEVRPHFAGAVMASCVLRRRCAARLVTQGRHFL